MEQTTPKKLLTSCLTPDLERCAFYSASDFSTSQRLRGLVLSLSLLELKLNSADRGSSWRSIPCLVVVTVKQILNFAEEPNRLVLRQWQPVACAEIRLGQTSEFEGPARKGVGIEQGRQVRTRGDEVKVYKDALPKAWVATNEN